MEFVEKNNQFKTIIMDLRYTSNIEESLFHITDLNTVISHQLLDKKGFYKIIWARNCSVKMMVDGYNWVLRKNEVIFCTPMNVIEMTRGQTGIISLIFNREFYCIRDHDIEVSCQGILFYGSTQPRVISLTEKQQENYWRLYQVLIEEFDTKDYIQGEMLRVILKRILIKSCRLVRNQIVQPQLANDKINVIRRFNVLVEEYFKEKHQVADYADMLNKSPKTISYLFKKYSEKTALAFIHERLLVEARRLLLFSDKTSEEIAYHLGYREPSHFSKFFKNKIGASPSEFRKKVELPAS